MPNLSQLVRTIVSDRDEDPEDIFASAPGLIFTDDLTNSHGSPDSTMVYKSRWFGEIGLKSADPEGEVERRLFSHYLWNAGIQMAEFISEGSGSEEDGGTSPWTVKGERVLELGAGVGLDGIVATLAGAEEVVISDYPAKTVLDNIKRNAIENVPSNLKDRYRVEGHEWGVLDTSLAERNRHHFTRILAADCYWMPHQHANLVKSMLHFLATDPSARIFAIAGFHTGRANLAGFFDEATAAGLEMEEIYEESSEGQRREWARERDGGLENHTERKKWLVICRLRRMDDRSHSYA